MFFEEDSHKIVQNFRGCIFYVSIRPPQNFMQLRLREGSQHELKVALFHKTDQKRPKKLIYWVFFKENSNRIGPNHRECICYIFLIHLKSFVHLHPTEGLLYKPKVALFHKIDQKCVFSLSFSRFIAI